jgi:hypothetical protein
MEDYIIKRKQELKDKLKEYETFEENIFSRKLIERATIQLKELELIPLTK